MKTTKKIICAAAIALTSVAFAQDYEEEVFEPKLSIGGVAETNARVWLDEEKRDGIEDMVTNGNPSLKLNFDYEGTSSIFTAKLKFNKDSLQEGNYKDILDEFKATAILGNWTLEAGKMRLVWGKTDKVHVLDNFNANDYSDFLVPDYNDRRIAEPMFRVVYATPFSSNLKFEAVYTPVMTPDRLGTGYWEPLATKSLASAIEGSVKGQNGKLGKATTAKVEANAKLAVINGLKARYDVANAVVAQTMGAGSTPTAAQQAELSSAATALIGALQNPGITDKTTLDTALPTVMSGLESSVAEAETAYLLALNEASGFNADSLYPDTNHLKYGQAGIRTTFTVGSMDLGLSYYYGHNKQPSVNKELLLTFAGDTAKITDGKLLSYDQLQVFGLEGAFITPWWLLSLNSRFEAAYYMTEDIAGDDPLIHNNSINWVVGFDRDLPIHNINLNIQTQGKYILKGDKINDSAKKALDVDFDANDCYSNNKIIVDITDTWNYENVKLDIKAIYGIERQDFILMPSLSARVAGNMTITASGLYMWCKDEDSEFYGWDTNSFAQLGIKYNF